MLISKINISLPMFAYLAVFVLHVCFLSVNVLNKIGFDNLMPVSVSKYKNWYLINCKGVYNQLVFAETGTFTYSIFEQAIPNLLTCKNNCLTAFRETSSGKVVCIPDYTNSRVYNKRLFTHYNITVKRDVHQFSFDDLIQSILPLIQNSK